MDLRETVAYLCTDRGYKPYRYGYVYVMDPSKRLKIYFMNAKTRKNGMVEILFLDVVIKEEYTDGKWGEIARIEFNSPMNCLKYNVDKLLDDIELIYHNEWFLISTFKDLIISDLNSLTFDSLGFLIAFLISNKEEM